MDFTKFISQNEEVIVPVLYFFGNLLKATPKVPNWMIPYILTVISVILSFGIAGVSFNSLIQGILVAGGSVLTNELIKQGTTRIP